MRKIQLISTIFLLLFLAACNYMDEVPYDWAQPDDVFTSEAQYMRPINQTYSYLPGGFNRLSSAYLDAATDDGMCTIAGSSIHQLSRAFVTSNSAIEGCWSSSYDGIRQALYVQKNLQEQPLVLNQKTPQDVTALKQIFSGEMYALRAYFEFDLLRHYGGYPIVDKVYPIGDPETSQFSRGNFADCVQHIENLCDSATKYLDVEPQGNSFGRMTKGAALAIKAKTLVYAASPLYNQSGNTNPLTGYINVASEDVKARWEAAAKACADVINLKTASQSNKYSLFALSKTVTYDKLFVTCPNNEYIMFIDAAKSNGLENRQYPPSISKNSGGGTVPTQELVDAFTLSSGADYTRGAIPQYTGLDPRFDYIIGYNGSKYGSRGTIYTKTGTGATMDALNAVVDKSTNTGYYLRKFLDLNVSFSVANAATTFHIYPLIRLADIYLMYAEAMTQAYGIDADPKGYGLTAKSSVQAIRTRAGFTADQYLTGVTTPDQMMNKIKKERRVELCFEEQRYFDLRRWMDGDLLNRPVSGVHIDANGTQTTYNYFIVDDQRKFDPKMYFHPIPLSEMKVSPKMVQNPGW